MIRGLGTLIVICAFAVAAGGCSNLQKPTASYKSMSISNVSASGFTMNLDVDIANPNSVTLPLTNADYSLALGGTPIIKSAKVKPASSIPAGGSATITIPVPLTFENLLSAEEAIRKGGGTVDYGFDAGLDFDTGIPVLGVLRVPFGHQGTLNVRELLTRNWGTILSSPAAKELATRVLGGVFKL
jgi:LEA14-like dessication related protein